MTAPKNPAAVALGSMRSPAKTAAARENAKRPRPGARKPGPRCGKCSRPLTPEALCRRCDRRRLAEKSAAHP
jgi:hypothetical protein